MLHPKACAAARTVARNTGLCERPVLRLGGLSYCFFPWLGTRPFRTLRRALLRYSGELGISSPEFEGCYYLSFKMDKSSGEDLPARLLALFEKEHTTVEDLVFESESPSMDKYDPLLPPALLRKAYAKDRLDLPTLRKRLEEWSR